MRASAAPGYGYRYRRRLLDSLKYVDARDLATGGDHIPELDDVYVDLALVSRALQQLPGHQPGPGSGPGSGFGSGSGSADAAAAAAAKGDSAQRRSISELLRGRSRVVLALVGQPGSGKSTLLAQVARRGAAHPARGALSRRPVPVLLLLREQAALIVADPAVSLPAVIGAAAAGQAGREPAGWWERQLRRGRCLVLLDGLDEVAPAADRLAVASWVERQIAAYPRDHFVVTSRPYGLPGSLAAQADVYVVRPLAAEQVQLFLDRWYLAAERHATGASGAAARRAVRTRARESAARLGALLREHLALQDLSVNPLLLTMIAAAHRYRGALPASRADLYGEISRVLLSRRVQPRQLPELLPWPAKQTLLAVLAYQMMRDHVADLPAGRILEILGPLLERYPASVTGEAFLDDIAHNGLLVEVPGGRYAFTHLTFQEYLAARHVSATPGLVKSLSDNVDDPWWHEAISLYAATADASLIVRACLDSGTIPALTLAFDCHEAGAEIEPELRRLLDRERARAYQQGCSPEHRRLIAGVQAARLVRRTLTTAAGTRICTAPVPGDLYWLFLADTQAPRPDSPCEPGPEAATGMWGAEAQAFVTWLNSITATATGIEVRLPRHDELQEQAIATALSRQLPAPVTGVWTGPQPDLWLRGGQSHPHELPGGVVRRAIAADAENTGLLSQVATAALLGVALRIIRDLEDARALASALDDDLVARADSDGQLVDLMHAHIHAIVLTHAHALDLTRADVVTVTGAADAGLVRALGLTPARVLADTIAGPLAEAIGRAGAHAAELAGAIDEDLSVLSAFDFDIGHAIGLARVHAADLDRAHVQARGMLHDPELSLASVLGLASVSGLEPALPIPAVLGLPLRWVADGPLAATLIQVLTANPAPVLPAGACLAFAAALSSRAGIAENTPLRAALGRPLIGRLRDLTAAASRDHGRSPDGEQALVLTRLTDACTPVAAGHQVPGPAQAAALRAVAVALAGPAGLPGADGPATARAVAATVTVVQNRSRGESPAGESVILALA